MGTIDSKEWLLAVAAHMQLSLSELAKRSGVSPSTVTRHVNDTSATVGIGKRTLEAISDYSGVPLHLLPNRGRASLTRADASRYNPLEDRLPSWIDAAVAEASKGINSVEPWIMRSSALDLLGVLPGDLLLMDQNKRAVSGDIVTVDIYDHTTGGVETIIRRYDPPYVTAHSAKEAPQKPLTVDDETVIVRGVMRSLFRTGANHLKMTG